jgi:delta 1-pyrroline-5-carboxylate dehydrogenase
LSCPTFGPTLPVVKVADEEEAIRLANDSVYGLSATVWTGDAGRGEKLARRLDCGAVNVNDALTNVFCPGLPMGGWKESGIGYRGGADQVLPPAGHHRSAATQPEVRDAVVLVIAEAGPIRTGGDAGLRRTRLAPDRPRQELRRQGLGLPGERIRRSK